MQTPDSMCCYIEHNKQHSITQYTDMNFLKDKVLTGMSGNCYQKAKGIFCPGYHSNPFQFSNYIELEHKSW